MSVVRVVRFLAVGRAAPRLAGLGSACSQNARLSQEIRFRTSTDRRCACAPFPTATFAFSSGERDGFPIVAIVNIALANYDCRGDYPWLVELEILAAEADARGMPALEEIEELNAVEERLQQALSPARAHFIARQTWNGRRMLDFYLADGPAARERVVALIQQGALRRGVTVQISRDDSWATWMPTLVRMCEPATDPGARGEEFEQSLLVRIPLVGSEFGSDEEQEAVLALADVLSEIAADSKVGKFDGYEFGEAEALLFAYGDDADALFASFEPALRGAPVARGAVITKRYGPADDTSARNETVAL